MIVLKPQQLYCIKQRARRHQRNLVSALDHDTDIIGSGKKAMFQLCPGKDSTRRVAFGSMVQLAPASWQAATTGF